MKEQFSLISGPLQARFDGIEAWFWSFGVPTFGGVVTATLVSCVWPGGTDAAIMLRPSRQLPSSSFGLFL